MALWMISQVCISCGTADTSNHDAAAGVTRTAVGQSEALADDIQDTQEETAKTASDVAGADEIATPQEETAKTASDVAGADEMATPQEETAKTASDVAGADEMATPQEVVEDGMVPINGSDIRDGVYEVTVDSSSSMFRITACELKVENGDMTAVMTMGGTGYRYLYMGSAEQAAGATEESYIAYEENADGAHTFTVPVEALDQGISCAAFSKKKEKWYDRTLLFRADSLPQEAFAQGMIKAVEDLSLMDGTYWIAVTLAGGSGKTKVESPAKLVVEDGEATATIIFGSPNYDYVLVNGERFEPVNTEGNSTFLIPVAGFDWNMPITADTTAMSTPHEIDYTLYFDSATIKGE